MKRYLLPLLLSSAAMAQFTPPPSAAYISNGSGGWTPATTSATAGAVTFTPPPAGLYCFNSGTGQWVPATSACLGGGGGGSGTVTSVSVANVNGVSGTVANPTTTPAITLILGAITPTSTNGVSAATMAFMDATSSVQTQLNAKQATGNYITSLTGDATGSGPGATAVTVSRINGTAFSGTNGDLVSFGPSNTPADSTVVAANVVTQTSNAASGQVCTYTGANKICIPATALPNGVTATTQSAGDTSTSVATDSFVATAVNNAIAGVNPAVAVLAASTANITGTYVQVGGGVGDTFTVTATGAFSLDGIALTTVGQRVLFKNQSTTSQNGVYTVTIAGTTGISPVFTRALDYDTPSDVNNTGSIPVQSGTVNTTTSWLLTSQVTSIGSSGSALTYAQFSIAPSNITQTICSGTISLGTSAIASAAAATLVTQTCTGLASTDNIQLDFNASPLAVTGYTPSANGMLGIIKWPTTNTINVSVVNNTAASITPGAITLNYRVTR